MRETAVSQEATSIDCPLCNKPARLVETRHKNRNRYECASCAYPFLIARKAEGLLRAEFSTPARPAFVAQVRQTPPGCIADIYSPKSPPDDPANARVEVHFISASDEPADL